MLKVADPNFAERTRTSFARQAIMQLLGAEMREVEAGRVLIALPFKPELTQQHGFFHGGATATIADSAGGYAGFTLFGPGESVLTVEFKLNLIAPADGDCLYAEGRVKKPGRTLTVCELEVWAERIEALSPYQVNAELMAKGGAYAMLRQTQFGEQEA